MAMGTQVDATELLSLLESNDIKIVTEVKQLIQENLQQNREAWLLNGLVDSYLVSKSQQCVEILAAIEEPHDRHFFDKLLELVKGNNNRLLALTLLLHLSCKQPPWLHKLALHPLFPAFVKCLKTDNDAPVLMTGTLVLTSILPVIPVAAANHLQDILDAFSRLAAFNLQKPGGNIPDVYLLHLQVGVYTLFHRLYGMYPCHLLTYLRAHYSKKDNHKVFKEVIKPMLDRVRMHPLLVTSSSEKEISKERWRQKEVHDIIVDCAKLSLDLIEGSSEEVICPIIGSYRSRTRSKLTSPLPAIGGSSVVSRDSGLLQSVSAITGSLMATHEHCGSESSSTDLAKTAITAADFHLKNIKESPLKIDVEKAGNLWSPSTLCGMSTPPPVLTTSGATEAISSQSASLQGTQTNTPIRTTPTHPLSTESPLPVNTQHEDIDKCDTGNKNPITQAPISVSANTTPLLTPQKRLSAISLSLAGKVSSWGSSEHPPGDSSVPQSPLKPEFTAEPPLSAQRMRAIRRIAFDSQESHQMAEEAQEALEVPTGGYKKAKTDSKEASLDIPPPVGSSPAVAMPSRGQDGVIEGQKSTPSLSQLPGYIDSLGVREEDLNRSDEVDHEILELTGTEQAGRAAAEEEDDEVDNEGVSHLPADLEMTTESVKQFMKQINRIRFNTYNAQREVKVKYKSASRSNSCPDLQQEEGQEQERQEEAESVVRRTSGPALSVAMSCSVPTQGSIMSDVIARSSQSALSQTLTSTVMTSVVTVTEVTTATCSEVQDSATEEEPELAGLELPGLPFIAWCPGCLQQNGALAPQLNTESEKPLYATFSPPDLLDRHIALGGEVHAQELSNLPLTSHGNVSWTHFGGVPPADEVQLLRSQLLLLHNQLMYERHKREQHAKRNRRLLGRIVKTKALEEQNTAMIFVQAIVPGQEVEAITVRVLTQNSVMVALYNANKTYADMRISFVQDQLRLQENEIQNLSVSLKLQQDQVNKLRTKDETNKQEREIQQKSFLQEIEILHEKEKELKSQLDAEKQRCEQLYKELQSSKARVFELQREVVSLRDQANITQQLKDQIGHLNKELLLMGELQQMYQQRLASVSLSHQTRPEMNFILDTYKVQLAAEKSASDMKTVMLDATKAKLSDAEENLKHKDTLLSEQKKLFEEIKVTHKGELSAMEEKYNAQKKIQLTLQAQLLDVYSRLGQTHKPTIPKPDHGVRSEQMPIPAREGESEVAMAAGSISIDTQTSPTLALGILSSMNISSHIANTVQGEEGAGTSGMTLTQLADDLDINVTEVKDIQSDPGSDMTISSASEA